MALPVTANLTFSVCRAGATTPAQSDIPGFLRADFAQGLSGMPMPATGPPITWTHVLLVEPDIDVRDAYTGCRGCTTQDTIWIPDLAGTPFLVIFVERANLGTTHDHQRVYLDRQAPTWPTNQL